MAKKIFEKVLITIALSIVVLAALAEPALAWRADKNKDGVVDQEEATSAYGWVHKNRRTRWLHARSKANTTLEKRYDTNKDGWLEPSEAKELLKDKYTLIKSNGKARVDTDIEREYDINHDSVIDADEAAALNEDLM